MLLAAIAVVVHGLVDRAQMALPDWVFRHRAPEQVMLFAGPFNTPYSRMLRRRAPAEICGYHRVWFHHRLLDKGTPDWWLPWWDDDEDDPALEAGGPEARLVPVSERNWPRDPAKAGRATSGCSCHPAIGNAT